MNTVYISFSADIHSQKPIFVAFSTLQHGFYTCK